MTGLFCSWSKGSRRCLECQSFFRKGHEKSGLDVCRGPEKHPNTILPSRRRPTQLAGLSLAAVCNVKRGDSILKFRRVTIRGAQPSATLFEEICLSEGSAGLCGVSLRVCAGSLRGSAGVRGIFRGFSGVVTLCL